MTKELTQEDRILELAQSSVFYWDADATYRIIYTDVEEGYFLCQDENTGEDYKITPAEVKPTDVFMPLRKVRAEMVFDKVGIALKEYRVTLHEDKGDKFTIVFDCMAEDIDHAQEQAEDAYPNGEVVGVVLLDMVNIV